MDYDPNSDKYIPRQKALPLKFKIKEIFEYLQLSDFFKNEVNFIERINQDQMPVRVKTKGVIKLEKYDTFLIDYIELHKPKNINMFSEEDPVNENIYKVLSLINGDKNKVIDVSKENILLTANQMYSTKDEIVEYRRNDQSFDHPITKQTKTRKTNKTEEKLEKIIALLFNQLAKESVKGNSKKYIKGANNINITAICTQIINQANLNDMQSNNLTSDTALATEVNKIMNNYPSLKNI